MLVDKIASVKNFGAHQAKAPVQKLTQEHPKVKNTNDFVVAKVFKSSIYEVAFKALLPSLWPLFGSFMKTRISRTAIPPKMGVARRAACHIPNASANELKLRKVVIHLKIIQARYPKIV